MLRGLDSRLAIVTGAAQGIGRATAIALARAGMNVAAVDRQRAFSYESHQEPLQRIVSFPGTDVSSATAVDEFFRDRLPLAFCPTKKFCPTVLVNCAGITRDARVADMTEQDWDDVMGTNLKAVWLLSRAFAQEFFANTSENTGSIINISSIVGKTGNFGQTNYAASKAGVLGLTKSLARELAVPPPPARGRDSEQTSGPATRRLIRCNAILPGFVSTPMAASVPEKVLQKFKQRIPLQRFADPCEVADVVTFLASENSSYMTGSCVEVTGGLDM